MGRPVNKKYFGSGDGNQIKVRAKIGANDEGDGFIVKQVGTKKFKITVGANTGICRLVNKSTGALGANEVIINVVTDAGTYAQATKLYNRVAIVEGNQKIKWTFNASITDGQVQVADVEGPLLVVLTQPQSVSIDDGDNATFSVVVTGVADQTYAWEVSTDDGANWTTVTNGGIYSNATTATLTLTAATTTQDGYLYRAVISSGTADNAPLTSDEATLTVTA